MKKTHILRCFAHIAENICPILFLNSEFSLETVHPNKLELAIKEPGNGTDFYEQSYLKKNNKELVL